MSIKKETGCLFLITIIFYTLVFFGAGLAAEPAKVLILPFNIHSDKDLSFLQRGVAEMLASRLVLKDKVVVIDRTASTLKQEKIPEEIDAATAVGLGEITQADYVLFGSLTVFGDTTSTDARFFDVHQKQPVLTFSELGKAPDEVISHINLLAARIKEEVFGGKIVASKPAPAPRQDTEKPESDSVSRKHPEKLLDRESGAEPILFEDEPAVGEMAASLWKTPNFKTEIKGVAIGDVDGDAKNETVFISSNKVFIFRYTDRRFIKITEIEGDTRSNFIGVDVADINANETSEIFVTSLSNENRLRSFVLEWNGTEFKTVAEGENWYFRVIKVPHLGSPILLGQKGGYDEIFLGGIYELQWDGGRYTPGDKQPLPRGATVYGFTYGYVSNEGQESVIALSTKGTLSLMDKAGNEEWASSETYGGSNIFILAPADLKAENTAGNLLDPTAFKGQYLQQRVFVSDLDNDKKNEVIVVKNRDAVRGLMRRSRKYVGGHFEALVWDNVGLRKKWKTRQFSGYISDYDVGDLNNDGTDDLVFSVIAKSGVFTVARSHIVSWSLKK